jgi:hypothetical protein
MNRPAGLSCRETPAPAKAAIFSKRRFNLGKRRFLLVDFVYLCYMGFLSDGTADRSRFTAPQSLIARWEGRTKMANDLQSRVDSMFNKDRLWAWAFVVALWATLLFVYFGVSGYIEDGTAKLLLAVAGILVGVFNTASIAAMISHYGHDKKFIYELDIKHLDANRR